MKRPSCHRQELFPWRKYQRSWLWSELESSGWSWSASLQTDSPTNTWLCRLHRQHFLPQLCFFRKCLSCHPAGVSVAASGCQGHSGGVPGPRGWYGHRHGDLQELPAHPAEAGPQVQARHQSHGSNQEARWQDRCGVSGKTRLRLSGLSLMHFLLGCFTPMCYLNSWNLKYGWGALSCNHVGIMCVSGWRRQLEGRARLWHVTCCWSASADDLSPRTWA